MPADLVGVNLKTAAYYFHRLREIIVEEESSEGLDFGILKRGGKVYTQVIPGVKSKTLLPNYSGEDSARQRGLLGLLVWLQCP